MARGSRLSQTQASMTSPTARRMAGSLPFHLALINPFRCLLFTLGFLMVELICFVYQLAFIAIPCALSRHYRRRFHHRRWNWIIAFWGRRTCQVARWTTGMTVAVEGRIPAGRHLVVANHQSAADILVLFELLHSKNLKFVVKKSLIRWIPVVSYALRDGGFGVVNFRNREESLENLEDYTHALAEWNGSPLIFPEGIRTYDESMGRFRPSGLRLLARETGLPVLPVVIDGLRRARTTLKFFLHLPGARCRVSVLPPVTQGTEGDSDEFVRRIESMMRAELERMRRGDNVDE